jgi:hypothetical protein
MSLLVLLVVAAAAFIKGAIGFGFPTLGTPLLALVVDVKTAYLVLIVPNIVMDGIQFVRSGAPRTTVRRMAPLVMLGAVGTVAGTHLLAVLSARAVMQILGGFILTFPAGSRGPRPWWGSRRAWSAGSPTSRARRWSCTSTRSASTSASSSAPLPSPSCSTRSCSSVR